MLLAFCASALAADEVKSDIAPDYQSVLGGGNASVELTDQSVMAAVANLKVYPKLNGVILPSGLKNYFVIRKGKEQAFLIIPHYKTGTHFAPGACRTQASYARRTSTVFAKRTKRTSLPSRFMRFATW